MLKYFGFLAALLILMFCNTACVRTKSLRLLNTMDYPVSVKLSKQYIGHSQSEARSWLDVKPHRGASTPTLEVGAKEEVKTDPVIHSLPYVYRVDAYSPEGNLIFRDLLTYWYLPGSGVFPKRGRILFIHEQAWKTRIEVNPKSEENAR